MLEEDAAAAAEEAAADQSGGVVRQLLQLAGGVSAGAIGTVASGPQASLTDINELPPGSDYRSAWANQANQQQAEGGSAIGNKNLVLLPGVDWWGLLLLGCAVAVVLLYLLYHFWVKHRATARWELEAAIL
jgi:hypothetical protein